jgi:hypothetical protein
MFLDAFQALNAAIPVFLGELCNLKLVCSSFAGKTAEETIILWENLPE